jgi:hypothetical protein
MDPIRDYPLRLKVSYMDHYGRFRDILAIGVTGLFLTIGILSLIRLFKPRRAKALILPFHFKIVY